MKLLKKSMLVLSVMTLVGGMAFAAAPKNGKKAPARKTVAKKVTPKKVAPKKVVQKTAAKPAKVEKPASSTCGVPAPKAEVKPGICKLPK